MSTLPVFLDKGNRARAMCPRCRVYHSIFTIQRTTAISRGLRRVHQEQSFRFVPTHKARVRSVSGCISTRAVSATHWDHRRRSRRQFTRVITRLGRSLDFNLHLTLDLNLDFSHLRLGLCLGLQEETLSARTLLAPIQGRCPQFGEQAH